MRGVLLVCAAALAFGARAGTAGTPGIDLAWDSCSTATETEQLTFACDSDQPDVTHRLAMTFRSQVDIPDFVGVSITLDVGTHSLSTPDWWRFGPGECRNGSFVFPAYTTSLGPTCTNIWAGHFTGGGFTESYSSGYVGRARLVMDLASSDTLSVLMGVRYVAGAATLDFAHTVSDGAGGAACGGCSEMACLLLYSVELFGYRTGEDYLIWNGDTRPYVFWQSWIGGQNPCYVATRNATWGAIKAMYR